MWFVTIIIAFMFVGVVILLFHVTIELNAIDKSIQALSEKIEKLYERQ
jgi:hypothetical protein